ncbi:MAG: fuculose phosphate aldolase [Candidatus Omnitrophica bacterium]|nr:fuculose phosphate aldolase [Candidatus Omnitrophota bacterium]
MDAFRELEKYGKKIHSAGLVIGTGGNISLRLGDVLFIKKQACRMCGVGEEAFIKTSLSELVNGKIAGASSETPLHLSCYEADDTVGAVVHVHPPYSIAAAERTAQLESVSYEFDCVLGERPVPVVDFIKPGSRGLAEAVARHIREGAVSVLLSRHGTVSVGADLEQAFLRAVALERACITFLHTSS